MSMQSRSNHQDAKTPRKGFARKARSLCSWRLCALAVSLLFAIAASPGHAAQNSVQVPTGSPLPGLTLVNDLNAAALNFITLNSGSSTPTAGSLGTANTSGVIWHDTAANELKIRNQADSGWIRFLDIDETNGVATADIPVLAGSTPLSVSAAEHFGEFVATGAQSFALAQTNTLWSGFSFAIFAEAGNAAVSVNGSDAINGGTAGVGATVPKGYVGEFRTDGSGNWYLHLQPSTLGTGTIASAATTDLCSVANPYVSISGTTAITSFGASCQAGQSKIVKFAGALTLTYNATSLILPANGLNITTAAGDTAIVVALGSSNYIVTSYQTASGQPLAASAAFVPSISGFLPSSITGSSSTASLTVSPGYATDSTVTALLKSASSISWSATNGNAINGISGGGALSASATIHYYLCNGASGTGVMASGIYPFNTALCPSNYNNYGRRIFSINTLASGTPLSGNAVETEGGANRFWYTGGEIVDVNAQSVTTARTMFAMTVPTAIKVGWLGRCAQSNGTPVTIFTSGDEPDFPPASGTGASYDVALLGETGPAPFMTTSTSGQIGMRGTTASGAWTCNTRGFEDFRRN